MAPRGHIVDCSIFKFSLCHFSANVGDAIHISGEDKNTFSEPVKPYENVFGRFIVLID